MDLRFKSMLGTFNVDEAEGIVECFVAAVGNKDSVGDIVLPGAFNSSLKRRKPRVVWGHDWNQPIGKVLDIYEVSPSDPRLPVKMKAAGVGGLFARVQFNLNSERGREAFNSIAFFGEEQEWSIGYKTLDSIYSQEKQANLLKEVELYEVSPVLHGANQLTATISIKSEDQGDKDQVTSLRKSKWKVFDPEFAEMIRTQHPDIWRMGGNIKGNDQYRALVPIHRRGKATSQAEINALELREAWVARHKGDFRLPGVIAQIKWLAVGTRGEDYMKNLVREAIKRKGEKSYWDDDIAFKSDEISAGSLVRWDSSGGTAYGKVLKVVTSGKVSAEPIGPSMTGSDENPAVQVQVWKMKNGKWSETDTVTVHRVDSLSRIDALPQSKSALGVSRKGFGDLNAETLVEAIARMIRDADIADEDEADYDEMLDALHSHLPSINADMYADDEDEDSSPRPNTMIRRVMAVPQSSGDCGCGCGGAGSCGTDGRKDLLGGDASPLAMQLSAVLGRVVSFYFKSHAAHWNVEGVDFAQYHALFGEIYADVQASIDGWAENIRKLGYPAPGSLFEFGMNQTAETRSDVAPAGALARELMADNSALIEAMKSAFSMAERSNEQGVANFIADRIDQHQKWQWFLSASLKNAEIKAVIDEIEYKAGRVIAGRNMTKLRQALDLLRQVVEEGDPQTSLQMKSAASDDVEYLVIETSPEALFFVKQYVDDFADYHRANVIVDEDNGEWVAVQAKSDDMVDLVVNFFADRQDELQIKGFTYGVEDCPDCESGPNAEAWDEVEGKQGLPFVPDVKALNKIPNRGKRKLRPAALDPDAEDRDADGLVQEGTTAERPKTPNKPSRPAIAGATGQGGGGAKPPKPKATAGGGQNDPRRLDPNGDILEQYKRGHDGILLSSSGVDDYGREAASLMSDDVLDEAIAWKKKKIADGQSGVSGRADLDVLEKEKAKRAKKPKPKATDDRSSLEAMFERPYEEPERMPGSPNKFREPDKFRDQWTGHPMSPRRPRAEERTEVPQNDYGDLVRGAGQGGGGAKPPKPKATAGGGQNDPRRLDPNGDILEQYKRGHDSYPLNSQGHDDYGREAASLMSDDELDEAIAWKKKKIADKQPGVSGVQDLRVLEAEQAKRAKKSKPKATAGGGEDKPRRLDPKGDILEQYKNGQGMWSSRGEDDYGKEAASLMSDDELDEAIAWRKKKNDAGDFGMSGKQDLDVLLAERTDRLRKEQQSNADKALRKQRLNGLPGPSELADMKEVDGPFGSQGGKWYQDAKGQKFLVKPAKSEAHAQNELAAHIFYKKMGINTDDTGIFEDGGKWYIAKRAVQNEDGSLGKTIGMGKITPEQQAEARKGFAADALASSWDVFGLNGDNVITDDKGQLHRIDVGGSFQFRAQGGVKPSFSPDAEWVEPDTMRTSTQGKEMYGEMSDAEAADLLEQLQNFDIESFGVSLGSAGIDWDTRDKIVATLQSRIDNDLPKILDRLRGKKRTAPEAGRDVRVNGIYEGRDFAKTRTAMNKDIESFWDDISSGESKTIPLDEARTSYFDPEDGLFLESGLYASSDGKNMVVVSRDGLGTSFHVLRQDGKNLDVPDSFQMISPIKGDAEDVVKELLGTDVHFSNARVSQNFSETLNRKANRPPLNMSDNMANAYNLVGEAVAADPGNPVDDQLSDLNDAWRNDHSDDWLSPFAPWQTNGMLTQDGNSDIDGMLEQVEDLKDWMKEKGLEVPDLSNLSLNELVALDKEMKKAQMSGETAMAYSLLTGYERELYSARRNTPEKALQQIKQDIEQRKYSDLETDSRLTNLNSNWERANGVKGPGRDISKGPFNPFSPWHTDGTLSNGEVNWEGMAEQLANLEAWRRNYSKVPAPPSLKGLSADQLYDIQADLAKDFAKSTTAAVMYLHAYYTWALKTRAEALKKQKR